MFYHGQLRLESERAHIELEGSRISRDDDDQLDRIRTSIGKFMEQND